MQRKREEDARCDLGVREPDVEPQDLVLPPARHLVLVGPAELLDLRLVLLGLDLTVRVRVRLAERVLELDGARRRRRGSGRRARREQVGERARRAQLRQEAEVDAADEARRCGRCGCRVCGGSERGRGRGSVRVRGGGRGEELRREARGGGLGGGDGCGRCGRRRGDGRRRGRERLELGADLVDLLGRQLRVEDEALELLKGDDLALVVGLGGRVGRGRRLGAQGEETAHVVQDARALGRRGRVRDLLNLRRENVVVRVSCVETRTERQKRTHACIVHVGVLDGPADDAVAPPPRAKEGGLDAPLHLAALPRLVVRAEQLAAVGAARLPRAEELLELGARRGFGAVVRLEEGALEEAAEEGEVRRADVLRDRVEEVEGREDVLGRALRARRRWTATTRNEGGERGEREDEGQSELGSREKGDGARSGAGSPAQLVVDLADRLSLAERRRPRARRQAPRSSASRASIEKATSRRREEAETMRRARERRGEGRERSPECACAESP